jgi:hypothetical protein
MTQAESRGEDPNETTGRAAFLAELQCFLCGSLAGSIESDRTPLPANGVWHPAGGGAPVPVTDWRQMRCNRCGGALFAESVDEVVLRDGSEELRREVPRRGRPPKWLVEERRRKVDSADSRL